MLFFSNFANKNLRKMAKENEESLRKILDFTNIIGIIFYILNVAFYCKDLWSVIFPDYIEQLHQALNYIHEKIGIFNVPYITLFLAITFLGLHGWSERGKRNFCYHQPFFIKIFSNLFEKMNLFVRPPMKEEYNQEISGKKKSQVMRVRQEGYAFVILGLFLILIAPVILKLNKTILQDILYIIISLLGIFYFVFGCNYIHRMYKNFDSNDEKNEYSESFKQNEELIENEYSVNLRTEYFYKGEVRNGWINVINPFRATQVLGTPGSGKSYAIINEFIRQLLKKNFAMYCYDFKFPDLSMIVYNHYLWNLHSFREKYGITPQFCVINFDDPRKSLRCNPIAANLLYDISDAYESAYTILLNLNRTWAEKQGDFFVDSALNFLTSTIWYLKEVENGKYCTLPHALEFINSNYADTIPLLLMNKSLHPFMKTFFEGWEGGAQDQLQGQIGSARMPLSRIASPQLYWIMTGDDFTLDINNPESPKILCVGNNPEKQDIYGSALGLYNGRIVKVINKKGKHKVSLIIDELPTIFFRGLDRLIATARSNKVSVCLGYQDNSQLKRDYGDKEANAIINTIGNLFSGQVLGDTANTLEKRFGKNKQQKISHSFSDNGVSTSISEQNDTMIPASKISTLSQGVFVGAVADNFGEELTEKIFHAKILIDSETIKKEEQAYMPLPTFYSFDTQKVIQTIKDEMTTFIENDDHYIIAKKYSDEINRLIKIQDVKEFISTAFKEDSKEEKICEKISFVGKTIKNQLERFKDELLSSQSFDGDSFNTALKNIMKNETLSWWLNSEKADLKTLQDIGCNPILIKGIKKIADFAKNNDLSLSQKRSQTYTVIVPYLEFFTSIAQFKNQMQEIRDKRMKEILHKQQEKIQNEIKELIDRQLEILDSDPRYHDISIKRKAAMNN